MKLIHRTALHRSFYKRAYQEQIYPRHLSENFFLDSLPLLRQELLLISVTCHFRGSQ
jgi:hypothetical protein